MTCVPWLEGVRVVDVLVEDVGLVEHVREAVGEVGPQLLEHVDAVGAGRPEHAHRIDEAHEALDHVQPHGKLGVLLRLLVVRKTLFSSTHDHIKIIQLLKKTTTFPHFK